MSNAIPNETHFPSFQKVEDLYPMGLDIPKTNDIIMKNKDITLVSTTPKYIYYNFYSMLSTKINTFFSGNIQYQISGKINEPNVIFRNGSQYSKYTSKKIYIFNKIHENEKNTDGELVIENESITNSDKKLFICFPLKTNNNLEIITKKSILDELIQNTTQDDISEINLNSIILKEDDCLYYETTNAKVIVFQTPIVVSSYFTGFTKGELYELQKSPENVEKIRASSNYSSDNTLSNFSKMLKGWDLFETKEGFIEGNDEVVIEKWMECDNVPIDYSEEIPTYQIAVGSITKDLQISILGITINIMWFISISIFLFFIIPPMYGFIVKLGIKNLSNNDEKISLIRGFELTWIIVLVIPAIIMISVGVQQTITCGVISSELSDEKIPLKDKNMHKLQKCLITPPILDKIGDDIDITKLPNVDITKLPNVDIWPNELKSTDYLNNAIKHVNKTRENSTNTTIAGAIILIIWFVCFVIMCFHKIVSPNFIDDVSFEREGKKILALPWPSHIFSLYRFWRNVFSTNYTLSDKYK